MNKPIGVILLLVLVQSCIKPAPPNPEADLLAFTVNDTLLTGEVFIDQAKRKIFLYLTEDAHESGIAPQLKMSDGASVSPASGDSIHFDGPVTYTVTSQSGANKKTYEVDVVNVGNWIFNFETWGASPTDKYEYPVEPDGAQLWSSGNPGVAFSGVPKEPGAYPTRSTPAGLNGTTGAEMITQKGSALSELVGIKLIAGSLFIGNFNSNSVFTAPLEATEFGQPYVGEPATFSGYYQYTPGASFQDETGNMVPGRQDQCAIYAIFYKGSQRLNGTNILTSDRIVATAILDNPAPSAGFKRFEVPFKMTGSAGSETNFMMAIVASSSKEGDHYRGAIGSKLIVDSLRITPQQ